MTLETTDEGLRAFNEFRPGSIHEDKFYEFWRDVLEAPAWILKVIKEGYEIPFKSTPGSYQERNNKTARSNMKIVRQIVAEMIAKGIVEVVKEKPLVVSPLGLVSKMQEDGSMKYRLVFDASRHINTFIDLPHVRLNHLDKALEITRNNDYQIVFDLASAYYHIKIKEDQRDFLGAAFENSDGSTVYFRYCHLPFGISSAVHIITKVWKPLTQYLNKMGIKNTIYIDDGRIVADTKEEARQKAITTFNVITQAGWAIEIEKTDKPEDASQIKRYLGFEIDTTKMCVSSPLSRIQKIKNLISDTIIAKSIHVKELAAVLGKIISLEPSHGMLVRVATRSGYVLLAQHTDLFGWKGYLELDEGTRHEFTFLKDHLEAHNGAKIKTTLTEVRLESLLPNPIAKQSTLVNHCKGDKMFVSDSSEVKTYVYELTNDKKTVLINHFSEEQQAWSSGARELMAVWLTLKQWQKTNEIRDCVIYWITDSENVVSFLTKGSRKPHVQKILFEIVVCAFGLGITIEPIHLLREDPRIQEADDHSKRLDSDNWSIDHFSFEYFRSQYDFDIDLFADANNARVAKFCSLYYAPGTHAVDAFSINWSELGFLWLSPPVGALIRIHKRITSSKCKGLLILPVWKTANFFPFFFSDNGNVKPPFKLILKWHPYIFQNENARKTAMFGLVPFQFAALEFNTC
jgi:hypothetical protein